MTLKHPSLLLGLLFGISSCKSFDPLNVAWRPSGWLLCADAEIKCETEINPDRPAYEISRSSSDEFEFSPNPWVEQCFSTFPPPPWPVDLLSSVNGQVSDQVLVPRGGLEVEQLKEETEWILIQTRSGKRGWVKEGQLCYVVTS